MAEQDRPPWRRTRTKRVNPPRPKELGVLITSRRRVWTRNLVCTLLVSGLLTVVQPAAIASSAGKPRVVVGVIDSPPNPYHSFFYKGSPIYKSQGPSSVTPAVLKEFGIDRSHTIKVTRTGNFNADFKKDKAIFDGINAGEPYWFKGTNVIAISFMGERERLRPEAGSAHGVGTGSAVLTANPEAVVVMVESPGDNSLPGQPGFATRPMGEEWAFNHPAIDIVSTSYGPPYSPPLMYHLTNSYVGVVNKGKLHFGASDNSPAPSPVDATSGPWWTVGIAGYLEGEGGDRTLQSGSLPDFLADFIQTLPYCRACEKGTDKVSGTSFSTPLTAGVASRILLEARRAASHAGGIVTKRVKTPLMVKDGKDSLTNWQIRRALEEAAYYPTMSEYTPGGPGYPIVEQAPWAVSGWGLITSDPDKKVVKEALAHLGVRGSTTRDKAGAPCDFMTANMEMRKHYWNNSIHSESNGTEKYPYIAC